LERLGVQKVEIALASHYPTPTDCRPATRGLPLRQHERATDSVLSFDGDGRLANPSAWHVGRTSWYL